MFLNLARAQFYQLARLRNWHINRGLNFGASLVHLHDPDLERLPLYDCIVVKVETVTLQNWFNSLKSHRPGLIWDRSFNTAFVNNFQKLLLSRRSKSDKL